MNVFFEDLSPELYASLKIQGITAPTEVQLRTIPVLLSGADAIVSSETGSGKTLAYLLPLFKRISEENSGKNVEALVLCPTRELASQIFAECAKLNKSLPEKSRVNTALLIGGANPQRQLDALKEKPGIVIGSPGRVLEMNKLKKLSLHFIKTIILDEGDRLLDKNNYGDVKAIIDRTLRDRQLALFSASVGEKTILAATELMKSPEIVKISAAAIPESIEHYVIPARLREKIERLRGILNAKGVTKALVYVNNPYNIENVGRKLEFMKINCGALRGDISGPERKKMLDDFRQGRIRVLIASDLASRGLDVSEVSHVINLDIPENPGDYLHRSGRTGRAGESGTVVSIATENENLLLKRFSARYGFILYPAELYRGEIIRKSEK